MFPLVCTLSSPPSARRWHSVCSAGSQVVRCSPTPPGRAWPPWGIPPSRPGLGRGDPRQPGGLPVLVQVASRRAWALRLRRADEPLASHAACRVAFPLEGRGRHPEGNFRSSITPPADALVYASDVTSRCRPQDSGSGWSRSLLSCRALASPATCRFIPAHPPLWNALPSRRSGHYTCHFSPSVTGRIMASVSLQPIMTR